MCVVLGIRGNTRLLDQQRKDKKERLDVKTSQFLDSINKRSPVYVVIGVDQSMVEDCPFYIVKVNSVRRNVE